MLNGTRLRSARSKCCSGVCFALLRNRFTVSSQTVVAGVEGTRFLFEVGRDRAVHVAVADGVVVCRSPHGALAPVRLRTHEGLRSRYPGRGPPQVGATDARACGLMRTMARGQSRARRWWCCRDGKWRHHGPIVARVPSTLSAPARCFDAASSPSTHEKPVRRT